MRALTSLVVALTVLAATAAHADTFTNKKTGEALKGKLVTTTEQDGKKVMFVRLANGRAKFLASDEWTRRADVVVRPEPKPKSKFSYFVIPIKGAIGWNFKASDMKAQLEQAAALAPTVVVLDIDTPGGDTAHAEEIVKLMVKRKGLRFVAFVRKALSAGVPITLACREIYVTETATIGAAVSYSVDRSGRLVKLPADVAEKMQSVWRATCRIAAEHGGHSPLISEAMIDMNFALTVREEGGRKVLERNGRGKVVKARGKILTLTPREAMSCGLAAGILESHAALGAKLKFAGWRQVGPGAAIVADRKVKPLSPAAFQQAASRAFRDLGLAAPSLTELQVKERSGEFWKWCNKKLKGKRVRWRITVTEVKSHSREDKAWITGKTAAPHTISVAACVKLSKYKRALLKLSPGDQVTVEGITYHIQFAPLTRTHPRPKERIQGVMLSPAWPLP